MQKLGLNEGSESIENFNDESKKGFWRRQFQTATTGAQRKFDWWFGVILPVVCFAFDPIVFQSKEFLGEYKTFAYISSYAAVMALAAWLIWGARLKWLNAFLAGLFVVGGGVAFGVGVVIFPISLVGLIFCFIGALGFTPLFTALVFLRSARRAFAAAKPFLERRVLVYSFLLAALLSAVVPAVVSVEIDRFRNERPIRYLERKILIAKIFELL